MAFIQYSRILKSIGLKSATCESTSLKIPLNTDNVFLLQTNNEYQVYRISSNELLYKGLIPKQFVASQYIEPLNRLRQNCIYLVNSQASVCKVNYRENGIEIHNLAAPEKVQNPGSLCLEFKILDEAGDYLLGFAKNVENMSTVLFIYDWVNKIYSNFVNLGTGFFNCIVSNLSQQINFIKNSQTTKPPEFQFLVVGQEDKKVCYKYITVQSYENSTQMQTKNHGIRFILKQSVKRLISNEYCPRGVYLLYPYMFLIANSKDGPILVQTNIEENASNRIDLKTGLKQEKGIIRQYIGIIDGNIIFTIHSIKRRSQQLCKISFSPQNIHSIKSPIQCLKLINIENNTMGQIKNRLESVRKSIDGLSFHRYNFQLESLGQELVKQNPDFEVKLQIETIIRIGKKYFYQEMAEQLHFPPALINQMISLL